MNTGKGKTLRFETEHYLLRSLEADDANAEWCGWLEDPQAARMLNAAPRKATLKELRSYISSFDRRARHILGIFEKSTGGMIGVRTVEIDQLRRSFRFHILIGVAEERGRRARAETSEPLKHWLFEYLDLLTSEGTILAKNTRFADTVLRLGWVIVKRRLVRSPADGSLVELIDIRLHRESWRRLPHPRSG